MPGISVIRMRGAVCFMAVVFAPVQGLASSIVTAGSPGSGPSTSIVTVPDTPPDEMKSVVTVGDAAPEPGDAAEDITVIRGGEIGGPMPPPEPEPQKFVEPMLDPNDRGTSAKRNALKRQAEEEAARQSAQPAP